MPLLELKLSHSVVGFKGNDLKVHFTSNFELAPELKAECIASSAQFPEKISKASVAFLDEDSSCTLSCTLSSGPLPPGELVLRFRAAGVMDEIELGKAWLLDFRGLRLSTETVYGSDSLGISLVSLTAAGVPLFPHKIPLFCRFKPTTSGGPLLLEAELSARGVWCPALPPSAGTYEVAVTSDGLNAFVLSAPLRLIDPEGVVITDVVPRLIAARPQPTHYALLTVDLLGRGLEELRPEQV